MAEYKGKKVIIPRDVNDIYGRLTNLSAYKTMIDELPDEQRARIHGVDVTADGIAFDAPGVGKLKFKLDECVEPTMVAFKAEGSPIPLKLSVNLAPAADDATELTPAVNIEIPAMLRPLIGSKIQEAADKFGEVFASLVK